MSDTPHILNGPEWDRFQDRLPAVMRSASRPIFAHIAARSTGRHMRNAGLGPGADFSSGDIPARSPVDAGPLRIVTGRLARSILGSRTAGRREYIRTVSMSGHRVILSIGSKVPYAAAHEHGFKGTVSVPVHQRRQTHAWGRKIEPRLVTVRSHTAKRNIRARPFLRPAVMSSMVFITKTLENHVARLLRSL